LLFSLRTANRWAAQYQLPRKYAGQAANPWTPEGRWQTNNTHIWVHLYLRYPGLTSRAGWRRQARTPDRTGCPAKNEGQAGRQRLHRSRAGAFRQKWRIIEKESRQSRPPASILKVGGTRRKPLARSIVYRKRKISEQLH
jgi:hypothetical protein